MKYAVNKKFNENKFKSFLIIIILLEIIWISLKIIILFLFSKEQRT